MTRRVVRSILWAATTTFGFVIGGFMFHFPGSFGDSLDGDLVAAIFGALIGAVSGVVVGLLQWVGLGLPRRQGMRLLAWMGLGIGLTHALFDGGPSSVGFPWAAGIAGLIMSLAYLAAIGDRQLPRVVVVGVMWSVALLIGNEMAIRLGLPWEETPVGWSMAHAIPGAIIGLIWGTATAVAGVADRLRD